LLDDKATAAQRAKLTRNTLDGEVLAEDFDIVYAVGFLWYVIAESACGAKLIRNNGTTALNAPHECRCPSDPSD
jgi:hypothetical protein